MLKTFQKFIETRYRLVSVLVFVSLICYAWINRFVQDDAFISFRYAKNFIKGWGLVFNKGERVEGYTNFLWTLIMSIPIKMGIDPVLFSYLLGILLFFLSLLLTYKLANLILKSKKQSLLTVFLLGTNYTFSCYATGGMETQLQTAAILISFSLLFAFSSNQKSSLIRLFILSTILAMLILIRPDSILFVLILFTGFYLITKRNNTTHTVIFKKYVVLTIPFLTLMIIYLIWKIDYYGNVLPNTYYVKASGNTSIIHGLLYSVRFLTSYWLFPFVIIMLIYLKDLKKNTGNKIKLLAAAILIWTLYIIKVGGDFMEFRFFVPVMPFLFIILVWMIFNLFQSGKLRSAFVLIIFIGSFYHLLTFHFQSEIESITYLKSHLTAPDQNWVGTGKRLGRLFKGENVLIAVSPAGAVPYFSNLPSLDMYGLNDPNIAREKNIVSYRPGHQKLAAIDYLQDQNVNILIGEPLVMKLPFRINDITPLIFERQFKYKIEDFNRIKPKILVTNLDNSHDLVMLYLHKSGEVNKAIEEGKIKEFPFSDITFNGQQLISE